MVHVFSYRDKHYIYDVGSASLHECDQATADVLLAKTGAEVDVTYISDAQMQEILGDINALEGQGLLFKQEVQALLRSVIDVYVLKKFFHQLNTFYLASF